MDELSPCGSFDHFLGTDEPTSPISFDDVSFGGLSIFLKCRILCAFYEEIIWYIKKAYLGLWKHLWWSFFAKINNDLKLIIFTKNFIIDVWRGPKYTLTFDEINTLQNKTWDPLFLLVTGRKLNVHTTLRRRRECLLHIFRRRLTKMTSSKLNFIITTKV